MVHRRWSKILRLRRRTACAQDDGLSILHSAFIILHFNKMVDLRNVTKRFASFIAVDDVTLNIRAGEFLTLLGPSGCGKTTLLRMIAGFERPDTGAVLLDGADVTSLPPYRRDVNQVFHSYALFPHLSVLYNITSGL